MEQKDIGILWGSLQEKDEIVRLPDIYEYAEWVYLKDIYNSDIEYRN